MLILRVCLFFFRELPEEGLPATLGGTWPDSKFLEWFNARREHDCSTNSSPQGHKEVELSNEPASPASVVSDAKLDSPAARSSLIGERKERKRKMDAIYACNRRKRERKEEEYLQEKCYELHELNVSLKQEEQRLSSILTEAKSIVSVFEGQSLAVAVRQPTVAARPRAAMAERDVPRLDALTRLQDSLMPRDLYAPSTMILLSENVSAEQSRTAQLMSVLSSLVSPSSASLPSPAQPPPSGSTSDVDEMISQALLRSLLENNCRGSETLPAASPCLDSPPASPAATMNGVLRSAPQGSVPARGTQQQQLGLGHLELLNQLLASLSAPGKQS